MNIKEALQKAETCAPLDCKDEDVCFTLAQEVKRLYALIEIIEVSRYHPEIIEEILTPPPPAKEEKITKIGPTPEAIEPLWEAA